MYTYYSFANVQGASRFFNFSFIQVMKNNASRAVEGQQVGVRQADRPAPTNEPAQPIEVLILFCVQVSVWWLYFQAVLCICFLFCSAPSKLLFDRRFLFFLLWRGPVCSSVRISSLQFFLQARSSLGFLGSNFLVLHCWNFYRIFFASVIYNLLRGRFHACSRLLSCIANCGLLSFISGLFSRILYCAGLFYSVTKFIIVPVEM